MRATGDRTRPVAAAPFDLGIIDIHDGAGVVMLAYDTNASLALLDKALAEGKDVTAVEYVSGAANAAGAGGGLVWPVCVQVGVINGRTIENAAAAPATEGPRARPVWERLGAVHEWLPRRPGNETRGLKFNSEKE